MKPILFSTPMVQAILYGRKTMTRRVIKPQPKLIYEASNHKHNKYSWKDGMYALDMYPNNSLLIKEASRYQVGDVLWVRETWCKGVLDGDATKYKEYWCIRQHKDSKRVFYKADCTEETGYCDSDKLVKWKPSIFMPKEACRIFLRVTNVRVERLQDISVEDCEKEGCRPSVDGDAKDWLYDENGWHRTFRQLWNSINGKGAWEANPFVFVYEFQRVEKPC